MTTLQCGPSLWCEIGRRARWCGSALNASSHSTEARKYFSIIGWHNHRLRTEFSDSIRLLFLPNACLGERRCFLGTTEEANTEASSVRKAQAKRTPSQENLGKLLLLLGLLITGTLGGDAGSQSYRVAAVALLWPRCSLFPTQSGLPTLFPPLSDQSLVSSISVALQQPFQVVHRAMGVTSRRFTARAVPRPQSWRPPAPSQPRQVLTTSTA